MLTSASAANRERQRVQVERNEPRHRLEVQQLDVVFAVVLYCYTQSALRLRTTSKGSCNIKVCKRLARLVYS